MRIFGNKRSPSLSVLCILVCIHAEISKCQVVAESQCERLKASLTYTQEEAPRDLSGVLPVVVERVNRVLEGVVDVEVEWEGADLQGRVGEHIVKCKVTRLASALNIQVDEDSDEAFSDEEGRLVATQCFHVPFSILDTNECTLPRGHPMRHQCHESSICINTIGSYECVCPRLDEQANPSGTADDNLWNTLAAQERSAWEISFNSTRKTSCPSSLSTHGCCPARVHAKDGAACRAEFRCPVDPCAVSEHNVCAASATCQRKHSPLEAPNYICQCPDGLMGNGRKCRPGIDPDPQPMVEFDGITATEETVKNDYYCDCTQPTVDACSGFPPCKGKHQICTVTAGNVPKCACKPGYVAHEKYGCVDESPPVLRLRDDPNGDHVLRLKQGDVYQEKAVDIMDENAEEYLRSLKIAYSHPLPHGCLTQIGEFHVNYTVQTPWTSPPYVRITRRVIIEDIDECKIDASVYGKTCPELVPKCDTSAGAVCVNTNGSYTCKCPAHTSGDGFFSGLKWKSGLAPVGFEGGTGCHDTSKPVINLRGPNPRVFRVCECGGISGIIGGKKGKQNDDDLKSQQQRHYADDIKELVRSTAGAELCASYSSPNPSAKDCVDAYDETYKGRVDLSSSVVVGDPVHKTPLHWRVPYNVKDAAGNAAETVWRDVVVEEVNLEEFESRIRTDVEKHKRAEIDSAVQRALEEDRKKRPAAALNRADKSCPSCPPCDCSAGKHPSSCDEICKAKSKPCGLDDQSMAVRVLLFLERQFPPYATELIVLLSLAAFAVLVLTSMLRLIFPSQPPLRDSYAYERELQGAVTYHDRNGRTDFRVDNNGIGPASAPPRSSMSTGRDGAGPFTPSPTMARGYNGTPVAGTGEQSNGGDYGRSPNVSLADSIYAQSPIITPSKRGDGVRRRSPYSATRY